MKKPANTQHQTEYEKFRNMMAIYEKVLHPDVWRPLMYQLHKVHEEALAQAYKEANISDEALAIERILQEMFYMAQVNTDQKLTTFNIKSAYKRILQLYKDKL